MIINEPCNGQTVTLFRKKAHHTTVLSFVNYLFRNKIMSSCGIQGLNQITEISDWIILETQRLANITPPEKWDVQGGINTPYKIISKIIGATNCKCHEGRQIQSDNPRSRNTSYCFEEEDLADMRHKLLQIMASTEERFRHNIKERNNSEASGVIKKGDQDHYVFDGASPTA